MFFEQVKISNQKDRRNNKKGVILCQEEKEI